MDKKPYRHLRSFGALVTIVTMTLGVFSEALAADETSKDIYSLVTSTTKWSYGQNGEVTNDFLEKVRTEVIPSVKEELGNRGKFGYFEAIVPKFAKMEITPVELRFKDGEPTELGKQFDGDVISKSVPKDWYIKDGDWTISCLFNGCISSQEYKPDEVYPKMNKFRESISNVAKKVGSIKNVKTLENLSKALKKALTSNGTMSNQTFASYYLIYLITNERLAAMK